jgi:ketosteroid isomerase-like protein
MADETNVQADNKAHVAQSFERWRKGTGGPFELLAPDAEWTMVGSSRMSRTYRSRREFLDQVIGPFNARMAKPLVPSVRGLFADGDTVIVLFDAAGTAKDGEPYSNTYSWYFQMKQGRVVKATAFFDTQAFDELWARVPAS